MMSSYCLTTTFRLTFNVGPNSPVGIEKSCGKIANFWIFCAFEVACRLAREIPSFIAA